MNPEFSLEGLMLKLKLQYFGRLMRKADSLEKTLMLGKIESRRRGQQRMRWLDGIIGWMDMSALTPGDSQGQGNLKCCRPWGRRVRLDIVTEQQQNAWNTVRDGEGNGNHSSTLAWKTPWPEEPGGLQPIGSQSRTRLSDFTSLHLTGRKVSECLETKNTDICTFETSKIM